MKKASLHTLGCRLNQSETLIIKDQLAQAGYSIVPFGEPADLGIINTCTVTKIADSKSRQTIRQFITANPQAYVAVVGCYSQMGSAEIASIPGVDLILGNQDKLNVLDYIGDATKAKTPVIVRDKIDKNDFSINFVGDYPINQRANLKIQDGCDFVCSFCRIPFARGRARSRDWDNLLEEAHNLASRGVRELVLTGVNIGTYDNNGKTILDIVDHLNALPQIIRIRISSIEPTTIPTDLFDRMADPDHALMPFLHIPLQAGSDPVLKAMRRKYTLQEYLDFINRANQRVPNLYINTDIMIAFPSETDALFEHTCQTFLDNPFASCHVFTYSEREETLSAKKYQSLDSATKQYRSAKLRRLSAQKRFDYYARYLGQTLEVLFEDPKEGGWPGYTQNFIRVFTEDSRELRNKRVLAQLTEVTADFVRCNVLEILD